MDRYFQQNFISLESQFSLSCIEKNYLAPICLFQVAMNNWFIKENCMHCFFDCESVEIITINYQKDIRSSLLITVMLSYMVLVPSFNGRKKETCPALYQV